ncbi:type VI secretion protein VasK [Salmonella enterica]|uniref:Type VI secretion protein VasK n=3 Tax=Salmonella enterica TaxID=28901 RepID=A0A3S5YMU4_SALER|nr:type VI secretion protein VasK [Salmonella enterica]EBV8289191.1 type VI secretion protein VasK [Salmonella enterica subsp. arizonae serovar 18:z4,z23:-]EBV9432366.1 type VI secretion protein VasK [Salmonella enterica subsp. enterica serovar Heidelberg]ECC3301408.1 type VI secretion protein VasK [Salmonella enterica subsp. arizonae]ECE0069005.1 type VI secretion protein VasK [Salmonella enterica subsp. enterica]ECU7350167.1 type VI secretion protein VasK [Salmonella enterica subsp. enterica
MAKDSSAWRGSWGGLGFTAIIAAILAWAIWSHGDAIGLNSEGLKTLGIVGAMILLLLIRHGRAIGLALKQRWSRFQAERKKELPTSEGRVEQTLPRNVTVDTIRLAMRNLYGRRWGRKTRILLITGTVAEVEQLTPGLTGQLWQEDRGTLLLWGGDLNSPADSAWLTALRKLRRRPVDGLVWVTSAFDQLSAPGLEPPLPVPSESTMDSLSHAISARMEALGWQTPLYVWSLHPRAGKPEGRVVQATGCLLPAGCLTEGLAEQLSALTPDLTSLGLQQTCGEVKHNFLLTLADQLIREPQSVTTPLSVMLNPYRPLPLAGVVFSQPSAGAERAVAHHWGMDKRWDVLPESVRTLAAGLRPRKPGIPWRKVFVSVAALAMVGWAVWMGIAYVTNRSQIDGANVQASTAARQNQPLAQRLHALSELQKTLARLQYRSEHGVPWYERAGLSQNNALLAALWPRYQDSALPLLRDASANHLQRQINAFNALPPDSPLREQMAKTTYDQLKLYLMLARPEHMDAAWFSSALLHDWPKRDGVKDAVWQGVAPSLLTFYGAQLNVHPEWKLSADESMVSQARSLLVRLMGVRNSESTLYQKMLAQVAHLYADMRLEDMTGDTDASRLFSTPEIVPGMFTRQAWEQAVQPAIEKVVKARRDELDWVLTDSKRQVNKQDETSPEALKKRLTERYFADFGGAWLEFLNSLHWNQAATLSDSIDQLTLMADVRQSPLVALMNTLNAQGRTGQTGEAISDSLVKSAKNLLGGDNKDAIDQSVGVHGPLDAAFGPVLALVDKNRTGAQELSLQSYLTRVTQVRLRLQQVTNAADPQAMTQTIAQTVFQGKAVDLTETRDYGSLIAAGLGQEWSGFGRTMFVNPMEQAWQQVLIPAADSLNAQWQQAVVSEWNSAFGGRYPFSNSSSDVSLPLLAKYLNADSGRIAQFLQNRLKGVLHKEGNHWVPDSINSQGLAFSPAFLNAINTLSYISDVAFTEGNAGVNFELRPGTADGVMQTDIIIDSQKLTYVNQLPAWKRFTWPADTEAPGANLSWISTQAGTRQYADIPGSWGLIRLLDKARVKAYPGVGSSYSLSWKAQDGRTLNYTLRTEAGEGPLVLLKLRNFRLPKTIFSTTGVAVVSAASDAEEVY